MFCGELGPPVRDPSGEEDEADMKTDDRRAARRTIAVASALQRRTRFSAPTTAESASKLSSLTLTL